MITPYPVSNTILFSWKPYMVAVKLSWIPIMKYCSLLLEKKQQILIPTTYHFINVVNGVSRSHETANIFLSFDSVAQPVNWNV